MWYLTIKQKLALVAVLFSIGMLSLLLLNYFSGQHLRNLQEARLQVSEIGAGMLTLRRNEKDFLARYKLKYQDKFARNYALLQQHVSALKELLRQADLDTSRVSGLASILADYRDTFDRLVQTQQKVGLDHKTGLQGSLRKAVHNAEERLKQLDNTQLFKDMLMLRRREKDFLLRMDPKYTDKFNQDLAIFRQDLSNSSLPSNDRQDVLENMQRYQQDFLALVKGYEERGLNSEHGLLGKMRNIVHQSETDLAELATTTGTLISKETRRAELFTLTGSALLLVVLVALIIYIARSIIRPIKQFAGLMEKARSTHDLSLRADIRNKDEVANMAASYNSMMDDFNQMLHHMRSSAEQLGTASEQLIAISHAASEDVQRQNSETEQVATAMNEMTATVQEVARNASEAANSSRAADEEARNSKDVVSSNLAGIQRLACEVQNTTEVINTLSHESENIGTVLNVIREIAEQTNLLALNAAIEAARAGEQGRGFAVVADEVRTLAQRSQQSTQEIEDIVDRLQQSASRAVNAMHQGKQQTDASVSQAESVGDSLQSIANAVTVINDMNLQIASAAEEQSSVADEINRNVANISLIAAQSTENVQQTNQTSESLAAMAAELLTLISRFRLA